MRIGDWSGEVLEYGSDVGRIGMVKIREWVPGDDVRPVTALLHRAYAELAAMGLRYVATHQDDETTRLRLAKDTSWVAEDAGVLVGTIAVCPWTSLRNAAEGYRRPGLWLFHQFGVDPPCQRRGIGSKLLAVAEDHARRNGATEFACDTAEGATHLIALYERLGFEIVGEADFEDTNYKSFILVKRL